MVDLQQDSGNTTYKLNLTKSHTNQINYMRDMVTDIEKAALKGWQFLSM